MAAHGPANPEPRAPSPESRDFVIHSTHEAAPVPLAVRPALRHRPGDPVGDARAERGAGSTGCAGACRARAYRVDPLRCRGHDRHAAERAEVLHPAQYAAGKTRQPSAGGEGGLGGRGERPAGAGAFPRAHGLQRYEALQARRADCGAGIDRRAARPARQRLHIVRRNGLHVPAADRQAGPGRKRHAGAGGLRRRHEPRSGGDRQGARRRHRGVARRARRGLTPARSADPRPLLRVQVRRTPAHRQAGHSQGLQAGTAARLLHEVVPPRPHGDRRRRRHHGRRDGSDGAQGVRRPDETGGGRAGPHLRGAAADRPAGQDGDRPRSDAVIGLLDQQAAADAGGNRRRVPPRPGAPAGVPDAERAIRRAVAQARRAVPRRRRLRERLEPDDVDRGAGGERPGREDSGGPVVRGD